MARKTKEEAQKTRDQILDAAEHVFYRKGYTLTTMADIAEAAQLSRGAVYGHYKGKLEVATAMAERVIAEIPAFECEVGQTALQELQRYCLQEVRSYIEPSSMQRVLFFLYIGIDDSPELLQLRYRWEKQRIAQIDSLLAQAMGQSELSSDTDLVMTSLFCQSMIEGVFSIVHFGSLPAEHRWQTAEQLCAFGLQRLTLKV